MRALFVRSSAMSALTHRADLANSSSMKIARLLLLTVLLAATSVRSNAADWPQWRGPDQNGISKETGWSAKWPAAGPKQLWKVQVGVGYSAFSVSNGRVYTTGNNKDKLRDKAFNEIATNL